MIVIKKDGLYVAYINPHRLRWLQGEARKACENYVLAKVNQRCNSFPESFFTGQFLFGGSDWVETPLNVILNHYVREDNTIRTKQSASMALGTLLKCVLEDDDRSFVTFPKKRRTEPRKYELRSIE